MSNEYITKRAFSSFASESLYEEVMDELKPDEIQVESQLGKSVEVEDVEETDPGRSLTDRFVESVEKEEEPDTGSEYITERGYQKSEIDFEDNEGVERAEGFDNLAEKKETLSSLNDKFVSQGVSRRYVMSKADVPDTSLTFEDQVGQYFYKIDSRMSPSECVEKLDEYESWFGLSEDERVRVGVLALTKEYPWAVADIMENEKDASRFFANALEHELMTAEKRDINEEFSHKLVSKMSDAL